MKHDTQRTEGPVFPGSDHPPHETETHRSSSAAKDSYLQPELNTTWDDWKSVRDLD